MEDAVRRIHDLIGNLSEAIWKRVEGDPDNWSEILLTRSPPNCGPETLEEVKSWDELTNPSNRDAFYTYLDYWKDVKLSDHAMKLHAAIESEMLRRSGQLNGTDLNSN
jgi:hypothetical protein